MLTLITGGARSGKSTFAQSLCQDCRSVTYVATATASDDEMGTRIAHHRAGRPAVWQTIEEPIELPGAIIDGLSRTETVLVDCITLWLSNLVFAKQSQTYILEKVDELIEATRRGAVIAVTNEVGSGIVPESALGRSFRDLQGFANQRLAKTANSVYLVACGLPLKLK